MKNYQYHCLWTSICIFIDFEPIITLVHIEVQSRDLNGCLLFCMPVILQNMHTVNCLSIWFTLCTLQEFQITNTKFYGTQVNCFFYFCKFLFGFIKFLYPHLESGGVHWSSCLLLEGLLSLFGIWLICDDMYLCSYFLCFGQLRIFTCVVFGNFLLHISQLPLEGMIRCLVKQ